MRPTAPGRSHLRYDVPDGLTLVTTNTAHFGRVGGLPLDSWAQTWFTLNTGALHISASPCLRVLLLLSFVT